MGGYRFEIDIPQHGQFKLLIYGAGESRRQKLRVQLHEMGQGKCTPRKHGINGRGAYAYYGGILTIARVTG